MSQASFKIAFVTCTLVALADAAMVVFGFLSVPSELLHDTHLPAYAIGAAMWAGLASAIYSRHWGALVFVVLLLLRAIFSLWQVAAAEMPTAEPFVAPYLLYSLLSITLLFFVGDFVIRAWRKGMLK